MIVDLKKDSNTEQEIKLISVKQSILKSNTLKRAAVKKQEELDECLKEKKRLAKKKKICRYLLVIDTIYKNDVH